MRNIKVIKPNNPTSIPIPVDVVRTDSELRIERVKAIKKWITERRENDRIERVASSSRIRAWRKLRVGLTTGKS